MTNTVAQKALGQAELERSLTAVLEISQVINLSLGLREMLQLLAQKVHNLMGYDCAVILLDPDTLVLTWAGYYGLSDDYVRAMNEQHNNLKTPEMAQGATGRAFRSRRPAQITDIRDSSVRLWRDMALKEGIESFIATPMTLRDRVLGFINCYTRRPHVFSPQEIELLSIIANQAAIAVEAAKLYDQERQRAAEQARLNQILREQHQLLERQNAQLLQAEQIHRQLTEVSLQDGGLEAIVARVAQLISRPLVLYDTGFTQLAASGLHEPVDELHYAALRAEQFPQALLEQPEVRDDVQRLRSQNRPVRLSWLHADARFSRYVIPVTTGRSILGYLVVVESPDLIDELDMRAVEYGATLIALELLKQRAVMDVEQQLRGGFLDDLLSGDYESEEVIVRRARYLGFDLSASYRVFVIGLDYEPVRGRGEHQAAPPSEDLRRRVASLAEASWAVHRPKGAVTVRGDAVVVLRQEIPGERIGAVEAARMLKDEITASLRGPTVSVGIGSVCREPASFSRSYNEARYCLEVLHRFGNRDRILAIEQLGLHRFLLRSKDDEQLLEFAHLRLDRLLEHDRKYSVQLLKTLTVFLDLDCSLTRTAKHLLVHVNTIQSRLQRIEELSGVNLRSSQGLMEIHLALLVASLCPREFPGLQLDPVLAPPRQVAES